jgi:hypothetical protein
MRVFINLYLARLTSTSLGPSGWSATARLWIKQIDHVFQAVAILGEQSTKLGLKFDFFLEASIVSQGFESLELFGKVFFELAEFCELGHVKPPCHLC